ncbi:MAG: PadR family transcriptional regulator [Vicinamibacteraceae bacterium]
MNLTYQTTLVLQALANGLRHGFDILDATGLPSGTVYPILRRLEREALVSAQWEDAAIAHEEQRPPRRYYELTADGHAVLETAVVRYRVPRAIAARLRRLRPARSS